MRISCAAQHETKLDCCKRGPLRFNIATRIARERSIGFDGEALTSHEAFCVSRIIGPDESFTRCIGELVDYREALQVREFTVARARLVLTQAE